MYLKSSPDIFHAVSAVKILFHLLNDKLKLEQNLNQYEN